MLLHAGNGLGPCRLRQVRAAARRPAGSPTAPRTSCAQPGPLFLPKTGKTSWSVEHSSGWIEVAASCMQPEKLQVHF